MGIYFKSFIHRMKEPTNDTRSFTNMFNADKENFGLFVFSKTKRKIHPSLFGVWKLSGIEFGDSRPTCVSSDPLKVVSHLKKKQTVMVIVSVAAGKPLILATFWEPNRPMTPKHTNNSPCHTGSVQGRDKVPRTQTWLSIHWMFVKKIKSKTCRSCSCRVQSRNQGVDTRTFHSCGLNDEASTELGLVDKQTC